MYSGMHLGRIESYSLSFQSTGHQDNLYENILHTGMIFRPYYLMVIMSSYMIDISEEKLVTITDIEIDGNQQFVANIDAYHFSVKNAKDIEQEFLTEHQLVGRSDEYIQEYLDDNELSIPVSNKIQLPTIYKDVRIKIRIAPKAPENLIVTFTLMCAARKK
jgi:hypothetical protein